MPDRPFLVGVSVHPRAHAQDRPRMSARSSVSLLVVFRTRRRGRAVVTAGVGAEPVGLIPRPGRHSSAARDELFPGPARCDRPARLRESSTAVVTPSPAGPSPPRDPRAAFAELSKIMLDAQPLSQTLTRVADLAKETIPGAVDVSVTLIQDGKAFSVAFTGPLAAQFDERQYEAGFGPCMDAALSGRTVTIDDTAASDAYPDFGRVAQRHR